MRPANTCRSSSRRETFHVTLRANSAERANRPLPYFIPELVSAFSPHRIHVLVAARREPHVLADVSGLVCAALCPVVSNGEPLRCSGVV